MSETSPTPWKLYEMREPLVIIDADGHEIADVRAGHVEDGRRIVAATKGIVREVDLNGSSPECPFRQTDRDDNQSCVLAEEFEIWPCRVGWPWSNDPDIQEKCPLRTGTVTVRAKAAEGATE